jgi:PAS domain-containing protein
VVLLTSHEPILLALAGLLIFCYLVVGLSCLSHAKVFVDRLVAGDELERQKQVVSLLLSDFEEGSSDWLWEVDATGALTYVSERMAEAAGVPREDADRPRGRRLGADGRGARRPGLHPRGPAGRPEGLPRRGRVGDRSGTRCTGGR